jgi:hypothetical protein
MFVRGFVYGVVCGGLGAAAALNIEAGKFGYAAADIALSSAALLLAAREWLRTRRFARLVEKIGGLPCGW